MNLKHFAIFWMLLILLLQPLGSAKELSNPAVYRIHESYKAINPGPGDAVVTIYLLKDWLDWASQQVLTENLPSDQVSSTEDNRSIRISISPGTHEIAHTWTGVVYSCDLQLDPDTIGNSVPADFGHTSFVNDLWENKPELVAKARELTDDLPNFYYKAKAIFEFVRDNLQYVETDPVYSAYETYQHGYGDCADKANLFIGLCRAVGIPTKFVSTHAYPTDYPSSVENIKEHAFAIVYLPGAGWAPVDLTWDDPYGLFGELSFDHIVSATSDGGDMFSVVVPGKLIAPDVARISNGTIERERYVLVREVALKIEELGATTSELKNDKWRWSVKIKNFGARTVENLKIEIQVDETYFEPPSLMTVEKLPAGAPVRVEFDLGVKGSVENSTVKAVVSYDWAFDGFHDTFKVEATQLASVSPAPPIPGEELINLLLLLSIVAIVCAAIAISIVLVRR